MAGIRRRTTLFLLLPPALLVLLLLSPTLLPGPSLPIAPTPLHLVPPPIRPPHPPSHAVFHPHALPPLHLLLDHLGLASLPDSVRPTYEQHNAHVLSSLSHCVSLDRDTCTHGQTDVLLVGAHDFAGSVFGGWNGGEAVWAGSVVRSAEALGYTVVYSTQLEETMKQYSLLGDYVKVVVLPGDQSFECLQSKTGCSRSQADALRDAQRQHEAEAEQDASSPSPDRPLADNQDITPYLRGGIPAWKIFSFHFWSDSKNPLGPSWTLSPEPPVNWPPPPDPSASSSLLGDLVQSWSSLFSFSTHSSSLTPSSSLPEDNFYLGYSIESVCSLRPVVPASERRRQAYLFAKHSWFFQNDQYAWSDEILEAAKEEANLTLLAACIEDEGMEVPRAVTRLGERLEQEEFWRTVGEGVVMVGVGDPPLSPSPYDALCLGVPFINPLLSHSPTSPQDRTHWYAQQNSLRAYDPPAVYNVPRGDKQAFLAAVKGAIENPLKGRWFPDHMREERMRARVEGWVRGEWRERGEEVLRQRPGLFVL